MAESSVKGLKELSRKLSSLESKIAGKALRSSTMMATTPALKALRVAAPKGKKAHRTYKGRLVAPGFLSRSIARRSRYKNGRARVEIGVKKEAYYGVTFVERGTKPHRIPKRGKFSKKRAKGLAFNGRVVSSVRHPGARAKPWFVKTFEKKQAVMVDRLKEQLRKKIERHAKQ